MTQQQNKFLFTVSTYNTDADRAAVPLVLANGALAQGADVLLWLTLEGASYARSGAADGIQPKSFPAVAELLDNFTKNGGRIGVCPPCGKTHGVTDENMIPKAEWIGAVALLEATQERKTFTF